MTNFDPNIPNLTFYNEEMKKAMFDKLFFLDKIDADIIVDYGCADGAMIGMMRALFPDKMYIGYDISSKMITLAKKNSPAGFFTSNWSDIDNLIKNQKMSYEKTAIVLSSLLHEVYSYSTKEEIDEIKNRVFSGTFDYVCIRDMQYIHGKSLATIENVAKLFRTINLKAIKEHEEIFGPITGEKSFLHLLLKYRYDDNWSHEVKENYFAFSLSDLGDKAGLGNPYRIIYIENFCPLFIKNQILQDTGVNLETVTTHTKIIMEKKG